jgi:hypothetical protein
MPTAIPMEAHRIRGAVEAVRCPTDSDRECMRSDTGSWLLPIHEPELASAHSSLKMAVSVYKHWLLYKDEHVPRPLHRLECAIQRSLILQEVHIVRART